MKTSIDGVVFGGILGATSIAFGAIFACALPFAALAAVAGRALSARAAYGTVGAVWLVSQILGFTVHHYALTASTFAWGFVIGLSALAATFAARNVPAAFAFAAPLVAELAVLSTYGAFRHEMMSGSAMGRVAIVNVAGFAILFALWYAAFRVAPACGDAEASA